VSRSKRFQCVYLHVGLGKTGSNSIQSELIYSAVEIESRFDLLIPNGFSDHRPFGGNHSLFLSSLFGSSPERQRPNIIHGLNTKTLIEASNTRLLADYDRCFSESGASKLLLSAEGVGHFGEGRTRRLADWLFSLADEIKVIACIRHPGSALSSEIQQRLKNGAVLENLYRTLPHYSFRKVFTRLSSIFGKQNLILYDYAEAAVNAGGLVAEFFDHIGIKWQSMRPATDRHNQSMSHEGALLLSALNRQCPVLEGGKLNPARSPGDPEQFMRLPGRKYRAPQSVYSDLERLVKPELEWLEQQFELRLRRTDPLEDQSQLGFSPATIDALALRLHDLVRFERAEKS